MCILVFLGSAGEVPEIPWNNAARGFNSRSLKPEEEVVRRHFPNLRVIYLGAHEMCGCGFNGADPEIDHEPEELVASARSLEELRNYLSGVLQKHTRVWLYASESDELEAPELSSRVMTLSEIVPNAFYFKNRERLELRRSVV